MENTKNEICILKENGAEGDCEVWWLYDNKGHWRACVEHRDTYGNDTMVTEIESHEFVDGTCTVCDMKESKGLGTAGYLVILLVLFIMFITVSSKVKGVFKNANLDEHPFGLDKFRKF